MSYYKVTIGYIPLLFYSVKSIDPCYFIVLKVTYELLLLLLCLFIVEKMSLMIAIVFKVNHMVIPIVKLNNIIGTAITEEVIKGTGLL